MQRDEKPYNTGSGDISQYVTHEKLNYVEDNFHHEIKESELRLGSKIDILGFKIDSLSKIIGGSWVLVQELSSLFSPS